jgi:thioredoxin reductase (NADPH)
MEQPRIADIAIIGAGCAGLTAGIYSGRAELRTLVFTGTLEDKGGLLVKTSTVENFPGFPDGILGFDLISNMEQQAVKCGALLCESEIVETELSSNWKYLTDSDGNKYKVKAVIIATGSKPNRLNLKDEERFWSKGLSSCAVCDGALYKRKRIVVVGGGDSAMEEASFLTKFSDVTLIHRGNSFPKASKAMVTRVLENPKIKVIFNTVIKELLPDAKDEFLGGVLIENIVTNDQQILPVDGLFYGLGLKPNTTLFDSIEKDEDGYICNSFNHQFLMETSFRGVFVAGDAHDKVYRQAIVAAGDGCKAAMEAIEYVSLFASK